MVTHVQWFVLRRVSFKDMAYNDKVTLSHGEYRMNLRSTGDLTSCKVYYTHNQKLASKF